MVMTLIMSIALASGLTTVQLTQMELAQLAQRQRALLALQRAQQSLMDIVNKDDLARWHAEAAEIRVEKVWHSARQATCWLTHTELDGAIPVFIELTSEDPAEY
ncbi:MAG: hypothetical protein CMF13_06810 [Idiomarina sp.]|nr:hypothetical protein [Idiomarina sp.]